MDGKQKNLHVFVYQTGFRITAGSFLTQQKVYKCLKRCYYMQKILCHKENFDEAIKKVDSWNLSADNKNKIKQYFRDYQIGKVTGRITDKRTLMRYLWYLKSLEHIKAETEKGIETFLTGILKDKITSSEGKPYSQRCKKDLLAVIKRFLDWKHPNNSFTKQLKIRFPKNNKDIETLSDEEIKLLLSTIKHRGKRFLIAVLNSSGLRAEEFHNLRMNDFHIPSGNEEFVKITIRNLYSKTQGRTISLYEKEVLPIVKIFLAERIKQGIKPEEPVFKTKYGTSSKWLRDFGKKILNKPVHYHMFRHTSATRNANKMNRQQLCIYYGWRFSSTMPDVYIQRNGVNMADVDSYFKKTHSETQTEEIKKQQEEITKLTKMITHLTNQFNSLALETKLGK